MASKIIILGSSGTIGKALQSNIISNKIDCLGFKRSGALKFDVDHMAAYEYLPKLSSNDTIFLCFGETDLDYVEENKAKTARINVDSQIENITLALAARARIVFLSSEQVFGSKNGSHSEHSIPYPLNEYGKQKLLVESFLRQQSGNWVIVRIGSIVVPLFGANCLVEKTYKSMLAENARMAKDNFFSLTPIDFVISGLRESLNGTFDGKIVHLVSNIKISRYQLAEKIRSASKYRNKIIYEPCLFSDLKFKSRRPLSSYLISENDWVLKNYRSNLIDSAIEEKVSLLDGLLEPIK